MISTTRVGTRKRPAYMDKASDPKRLPSVVEGFQIRQRELLRVLRGLCIMLD